MRSTPRAGSFNDHSGIIGEGATDQDLLLVTTGKGRNPVVRVADLDAEPLDLPGKRLLQFFPPDDTERPQVLLIDTDGEVLENALLRENSFPLPVSGYVHNALVRGVVERADFDETGAFPVQDPDLPSEGRDDPCDQSHEGVLALAVQSRDADDRTLRKDEVERLRCLLGARAMDGKSFLAITRQARCRR